MYEMKKLRDLDSFTKEELKNYPPFPSGWRKELHDPDFDPQTADWTVTDAKYWVTDEDGSNGHWEIIC